MEAAPEPLPPPEQAARLRDICEEDYVADNAVFGPEDTAAVKETQQRAGLEANGVVDRPTWAALRAQSHTACDSCTEEG